MTKNRPWPQSGQMFIDHFAGESSLALEERNAPRSEAGYYAPPELQNWLDSGFYKYFVPPGLKKERPKNSQIYCCKGFTDTTQARF